MVIENIGLSDNLAKKNIRYRKHLHDIRYARVIENIQGKKLANNGKEIYNIEAITFVKLRESEDIQMSDVLSFKKYTYFEK